MNEDPSSPQKALPGSPYWMLGYAAAGLFGGYLLGSVASAGVGVSAGGQHVLSAVQVAASLGGLWVGLVGSVMAASRRLHRSIREMFGWRIRLWPDIPLGLLVGAGFQLVVVPALYFPFVSSNQKLERALGAPARQITGGSHGAGLVVVGVLVALGAPLVEELFFRGLLLRSLERAFGRLGPGLARPFAVVGSAVVFGLAHFELLQLAGLVLLGLVLGILAETTGRLGACTVAHAAFNTVAVVVLVASR